MPETKLGRELGIMGSPTARFGYAHCTQCGNVRRVEFRGGKPRSEICQSCKMQMRNGKGSLHPNWRGGRRMENGYLTIWLSPSDPFYPMQKGGGYVKEHRLVMAKSLDRCLLPWEIVHHKNHIKTDNRLENLELISWDEHEQITLIERRVKNLEDRIIILEAENLILRQKLEVV